MFRIPLVKPYIPNSSKKNVLDALNSGMLTEGIYTQQLEKAFTQYIGTSYAIGVTSCTTGLELVLRALHIGPGDEVIVPDYTYPATAFAPMLLGATAIIVDISPNTMLIDYNAIRQAITAKTKAIIPVSLFGNPLNWDELLCIKKEYPNISIIEDAACSLGSQFRNIKTGAWGDAAVFSMHPRKNITTGEGGMITTNNQKLAESIQSIKHFGMDISKKLKGETIFIQLGTNYKLSNIQSAIGKGQIQIIDSILQQRTTQVQLYKELLKPLPIEIPEITQHGTHAWQSFCIITPQRNHLLDRMRESGIEVQIGTYALHLQPVFQQHPLCRIKGKMNGSQKAFTYCCTLPLFHTITVAEQKEVISILAENLSTSNLM